MTSVGELLRGFRRTSGLTQEQLAERSGLSVEAIRTLEIGRRRYPRALTISLLADALGLEPAARSRLEEAVRRPTGDDPHPLPPVIRKFIGREELVRRLAGLLTPAPARTGVAVAALSGMGGVGKTALALRVGHEVGPQYPDGQIYLSLRGASEPLSPISALGDLLLAFGVPPQEIPDEVEVAAARYRTAVAGRRILVVLDDAVDADQVAPLIPGTPGSAAVITSRRLLDGLPGAEHLRLDVLSDEEGLRLLGAVAGRELVEAEPAAAQDVVRHAGNLPLAICLAGTRVSESAPLSALAGRLADETTRLREFDDGDLSVRATIAVSIRDLAARAGDRPAAAAFPALTLLDADGFPLRVAAAALDLPLEETEAVLDRLVDMHLLDAPALHRYRFHDLIRAVGRGDASRPLEQSVSGRVRDCFVAMIWRADELSGPGYLSSRWKDSSWAAGARDLDDLEEILDWLDSERATLVRQAQAAAAEGQQDFVLRAAIGLNVFGPARKRWLEWRDVNRAAAGLVDPRTDPLGAAMVHFDLGLAYGELEDYRSAATQVEHAVAAARIIDEPRFLADCLVNLAHVLERTGDTDEGFAAVWEALDLTEQVDAEDTATWATLTLGMLHGKAGDHGEQTTALDRAISMSRAAPPRIAARITLNAGTSYRECGQVAKSVPVLLESLAILREHQSRGAEAEALDELATAYRQLDCHEQAIGLYEEGLTIAVRREHWDREARIRTGLGHTYAELGRDDESRRQWLAAERILTDHGMPAADGVRRLLAQR